jgi:hypothetical protein
MCQVLPHLDCEQTVPISSCVTVGILGSRKIAEALIHGRLVLTSRLVAGHFHFVVIVS